MEYDSISKNIVVVQDLTNGLGHVIESETNRGKGAKKYISVESPTAPRPVPLSQMTWEEAEMNVFRIAQLYDPSLLPDREPSESESQIKKEVKLAIECAKKRLNEQN